MSLREAHDSGETIRELRTALQHSQRTVGRLKAKNTEMVEAVYQAAKDASLAMGQAERVKSPKRDTRKGKEEVALLHTTDWQVGKTTESYNSTVARARLHTVVRKVDSLADLQRAAHPVKRITVLYGGDMVEGVSVFPGQAYEVDSHLYEQLFCVVTVIEEQLRFLLERFEQVDVWDIFGNHGRIGRKGDFPRLDNIDRMVYRIVKDRFADEPRLTWHHADTWYQHVVVGNYTALMVHGDQVKSFGGNLPSYGIVRSFNAWKGGVLAPFRDGYIGHYHTHQDLSMAAGGSIFMSGSPESGNEFATEFVKALGRPSQRLHFVEPEIGRITAQYQVWLDE